MKISIINDWINQLENEKRFELFSISLILNCEVHLTIFNFTIIIELNIFKNKGIEKIKDAQVRSWMRRLEEN